MAYTVDGIFECNMMNVGGFNQGFLQVPFILQPMMPHQIMMIRMPMQGIQLFQGVQPLMGPEHYGHETLLPPGCFFGPFLLGSPHPFDNQWNGPNQQMYSQRPGILPHGPEIHIHGPGIHFQGPGIQPQRPGMQRQRPEIQPQRPESQSQGQEIQFQGQGIQFQGPGIQFQRSVNQYRNAENNLDVKITVEVKRRLRGSQRHSDLEGPSGLQGFSDSRGPSGPSGPNGASGPSGSLEPNNLLGPIDAPRPIGPPRRSGPPRPSNPSGPSDLPRPSDPQRPSDALRPSDPPRPNDPPRPSDPQIPSDLPIGLHDNFNHPPEMLPHTLVLHDQYFRPGLSLVQMKAGGPDPAPESYINPAFSQQPSGVPQLPLDYEVYGPNLYPKISNEYETSETFEEISELSNSTIEQAASAAAAGDFSNAIEILVEAISLIKKSKVVSDERCKLLISSMQSMLHGIQIKSSSARRGKSRSSRNRLNRKSKHNQNQFQE